MNQDSRAFLEAVVDSVADGHEFDWAGAERKWSAAADGAGVLRQLRVIATIAHVHRTFGAESSVDNVCATRGAVRVQRGVRTAVVLLVLGTLLETGCATLSRFPRPKPGPVPGMATILEGQAAPGTPARGAVLVSSSVLKRTRA